MSKPGNNKLYVVKSASGLYWNPRSTTKRWVSSFTKAKWYTNIGHAKNAISQQGEHNGMSGATVEEIGTVIINIKEV